MALNTRMSPIQGKKVAVVTNQCWPTYEYWLKGWCVHAKDWYIADQTGSSNIRLQSGTETIIVIRYLRTLIKSNLLRTGQPERRVILVMDDDLLDHKTHLSLGLKYQIKLYRNTTRYARKLSDYIDELWVTSDYLLNKYSQFAKDKSFDIRKISLAPIDPNRDKEQFVKIRYTGSASHAPEWTWVRELFRRVQKRHSNTLIEIVLPPEWRRRFRKIPRLKVLYPMSFETYTAWIDSEPTDLFLVPILDGQFGAARSHSKIYECKKMKSVGIYSDRHPYKDFIINGENGYLVSDELDDWVNVISELVNNCTKRRQMKERCADWNELG